MKENSVARKVSSIFGGGFLVDIDVSRWSGKTVLTEEILGLEPGSINPDVMRLGHVRLVPRDSGQVLERIENRARRILLEYSFPFKVLPSVRFVTARALPEMITKLDAIKAEYDAAADSFAANYPALLETQEIALTDAIIESYERISLASQVSESEEDFVERVLCELIETAPRPDEIRERYEMRWIVFRMDTADLDAMDAQVTDTMNRQQLDAISATIRKSDAAIEASIEAFASKAIEAARKEVSDACVRAAHYMSGKSTIPERVRTKLVETIRKFRLVDLVGPGDDLRKLLEKVETMATSGSFDYTDAAEVSDLLVSAARAATADITTAMAEQIYRLGRKVRN